MKKLTIEGVEHHYEYTPIPKGALVTIDGERHHIHFNRRRYSPRLVYTWALWVDAEGCGHQLEDPFPCVMPKQTEIVTLILRRTV